MKVKVYIKKTEKTLTESNNVPTQFWTHLPDSENRADLVEVMVEQKVYREWLKARKDKDILLD